MSIAEKILNWKRERKILHWQGGKWAIQPPVATALQEFPSYFLLQNPSPSELWNAWQLSGPKPLVVAPPSSSGELEILLRQVPKQLPAQTKLIVFTSGSTGEPKAVLHSEDSLVASAQQVAAHFTKNVICFLPAWGMAGIVFHFLLPLFAHRNVYFSSTALPFFTEEFFPAMQAGEIHTVVLNPYLLSLYNNFPAAALEVVSLTAPLPYLTKKDFLHKHPEGRLREIFGLSEAAGPVLLDTKSLGSDVYLAPTHTPEPVGYAGVLALRGKQIFLGYGRNGTFDATNGELLTGDLFRHEMDSFHFLARQKDLIDVGGRKVAPQLIEEMLEQCAELELSVAVGWKKFEIERPALFYQRKAHVQLSKEELSQKLALFFEEKLSAELRPAYWEEVSEIPRLKNTKVDREALRQRLKSV